MKYHFIIKAFGQNHALSPDALSAITDLENEINEKSKEGFALCEVITLQTNGTTRMLIAIMKNYI